MVLILAVTTDHARENDVFEVKRALKIVNLILNLKVFGISRCLGEQYEGFSFGTKNCTDGSQLIS